MRKAPLTATQPEKQAAIDLVGGTVIGGARFRVGDIYYVRVEGDGTLSGIEEIARQLGVLPQVWRAEPQGLARVDTNEEVRHSDL